MLTFANNHYLISALLICELSGHANSILWCLQYNLWIEAVITFKEIEQTLGFYDNHVIHSLYT